MKNPANIVWINWMYIQEELKKYKILFVFMFHPFRIIFNFCCSWCLLNAAFSFSYSQSFKKIFKTLTLCLLLGVTTEEEGASGKNFCLDQGMWGRRCGWASGFSSFFTSHKIEKICCYPSINSNIKQCRHQWVLGFFITVPGATLSFFFSNFGSAKSIFISL